MNWNRIIADRTAVRTKDNMSFGYVAGEYKDSFLVIEGKLVSLEYMIPKNKIDNYNGQEISLNMDRDEIGSDYKL